MTCTNYSLIESRGVELRHDRRGHHTDHNTDSCDCNMIVAAVECYAMFYMNWNTSQSVFSCFDAFSMGK